MTRLLWSTLLLAGLLSTARASTRDDLRLRPTTVLLAPADAAAGLPGGRPFATTARLAGGGGDSAEVSFLAGTGFTLLGGFANTLTLLPTLSFAAQAGTALSGTALLLSGVALWAVVAKADAWLFDIDRSWGSAFAGAGLGLATGAVLAVVLGSTVDDGPGFNKLAAGLTGFIFGGAIAAPLWTLADPFGLTPVRPDTDLALRQRTRDPAALTVANASIPF